MTLKKQILQFAILAILFLLPTFASAAGLVPCGGPSDPGPCTLKDIFVLIIRVTNTLIGLASILAVFKIIQAGFWLTVSSGSEESITSHKKWATQAIVGFVLTMFAYM